MEIIKATTEEILVIKELAYKIWPSTYGTILSNDQIIFMLNKFYSEESIVNQIERENQQFYLLKYSGFAVGFLSFELNCKPSETKLQKLYVLPEMQGKGYGKLLVDFCLKNAKENQQETVFLNVNRLNKAKIFYENLGFKVIYEEDIAIGNGYLMEDFVLEITL